MKLYELLRGLEPLEVSADLDMDITHVTSDSRKVQKGALFVAVAGFAADGNRFIPMAMEKGASVVVTAKKPQQDIPYVLVSSDRYALAIIGTNYYGRPAESMTMIGVTGTNGKTSTTWLLKQVLQKAKHTKVGLIGTMENHIGDEILETDRTTPESIELQALFAKMRDAGCGYAVMEVSSHALELDRVAGIHFDVAAFTNLTEDHLDFHKTMESYCDAKAILFTRCGKAVVNGDDAWKQRLLANCTAPVLTTSVQGNGDLRAENVMMKADGICFTAVYEDSRVEISVPIPGKFTVYNVLSVLGIALQLGISLKTAAEVLKDVAGVKGRVEVVPTPGKPYTVLIDYAHTPDGLENVLSSVRDFCKGRLIAVFGCGGDRDPIKRPIMGGIGVKIADLAVITSDNPRTEAPGAIIQDIVAGLGDAKNYKIVENRQEAIHYAMDIAEKDDIIVLAGKGHETYQEIMGIKHHLDEREVVAEYLRK
jgi:UDP-N-acetylmuramoyl-L-alanyl-D-glutamate--2,6-diaminopimelate ligase